MGGNWEQLRWLPTINQRLPLQLFETTLLFIGVVSRWLATLKARRLPARAVDSMRILVGRASPRYGGHQSQEPGHGHPLVTLKSLPREGKKPGKHRLKNEVDEMSDFLGIGDYICLYCEETEGFVYSWQTSSVHNGISIYHRQDREKPDGMPNPHVAVFQVCIQSRYKLNKKYRKLQESNMYNSESLEAKAVLAQAKSAAQAENEDNISEQKRQQGKKVRYGEVIQLKHLFTGKYIHVSTTQTSKRDKNNMMVSLYEYNAKHAQFRILPRYKVKSEGEVVQILDQIVFESIKSPGQYFHASVPHSIDYFNVGSELNLGVDVTGFTIVKHYKPTEEQEGFVRGGSMIRLFHKELEAYLVAEGLYEEELTEDVHLRIREVDQLIPRTLYPSTSGITYWQIEAESSILCGEVIRWESQVRFRHMTTRLYLCINSDMQVCLTNDAKDPNTVFRLHPIIKETDEIQFESYARIEHVLSGFWLHALRDEEYKRKQMQGAEDDNSMRGLRWDGASLRKISASGERIYHDAYTIQQVEEQHLHTFNFVAGMVPFLLNLIQEFEARQMHSESPNISPGATKKRETKLLNVKKTLRICTALKEMKIFMYVQGTPAKERQKLMRNLRIIDLLVRLLKYSPQMGPDADNLIQAFKAAYEVLHTYMIGNSRKNALYFAKYIDFFQTQFNVKGDIGLNVAQMIVELIRDNRKIVDRITRQQIDEFVDLLRQNKNYRYLDLLSVLCVCDGVAIPDNQTYITENWLMKDQSGVFLTERGQNIKRQTNVVYVSTDVGETWVTLHEFVDRDYAGFDVEQTLFLEHQLDLFRHLCFGRNDFAIQIISRELNYLTWEEAFLCLRLPLLPDALRAKYCDLVIGLFVDVGNNYSVLENNNISFVYDDIDARRPLANMDLSGEMVVKDLVTIFPVLRDWIKSFLDENHGMIATRVGHNMMIEQVLRLLHFLVKFGYYGNSRDIKELQEPLLQLLDGRNDLPFPPEAGKKKGTYSKSATKMIEQYRNKDRYEVSLETTAIVNAKHQALEVLHLILTYQFSTRLRSFVGMFKQAEIGKVPKNKPSVLESLLHDSFDALDQNKKSLKEQKRMHKAMKDMFDHTSFFNADELTSNLLDLTKYKYDKMVTKSLAVLNKYFSSKMDMFKCAVQAQVLITTDSVRVHREVLKCIPVLRRLTKSKLNDDQVRTMSEILDSFTKMCHVPFDTEERHPMNQSILINHEVLSLVFDNLSQEIDARLSEQYRGIKTIVIKNIRLLKALAKSNEVVQKRIYDRMDTLLRVRVVESEIALALKEAFVGNQATCLKVQPRQIEKIVALVGEHQEKVPEFLDLMCSIVKVENLDIALKRNQAYVMKFIMRSYSRTAYVFDHPREMREKILMGQEGENHLRYLAGLVDLLAMCAEGENRFIESLCQTILPMDEILWVLTNESIDNNIRKPYLKYLHWVFMRSSASYVDTGAGELTHDSSLWGFMQNLVNEINALVTFLSNHRDAAHEVIKSPPPKGVPIQKSDIEAVAHANFHFLMDAVYPCLRTFFSKFYSVDKDLHPKEPDHVNRLANALLDFCNAVKPYLANPAHLKTIMGSMTTILTASTLETAIIEGFLAEFGNVEWFVDRENEVLQSHENYYADELALNAKFRTFAVNCSLLYGGHNTVCAQIKYSPKWASQKEYTQIGTDEALPLGEEFQEHIRCFVKTHEKKVPRQFALAGKIIEQLGCTHGRQTLGRVGSLKEVNDIVNQSSNDVPAPSPVSRISSSQMKPDESTRLQQEELDIKCLQLLRAMIHNEIVKLPDNWEENPHKYKKHLARILDIQNTMVALDVVPKVLPLLGRSNDDIIRETLAFICAMLFNANKVMQRGMIEYFKAIREEVFFLAVRNRMQLSTIAIKEKRALAAQREARVKEVLAQAKSLQSIMTVGKKALQDIQTYETHMRRTKARSSSLSRRANLANLQFRASRKTRSKDRDDGGRKRSILPRRRRKSSASSERRVHFSEKRSSKDRSKASSYDDGIIPANDSRKTSFLTPDYSPNHEPIDKHKLSVDVAERRGSAMLISDQNSYMNNHMELRPVNSMEVKLVDRQDSLGEDNMGFMDESLADNNTDVGDDMEYKDEGYIELVLKVLAQMCDGQFTGLQDYLRDQPDNIKSFNIIAETTAFLNMVYSNITNRTIDLVIQLFTTLNEFCSGNQANRAVIVTHKVVDYINFILRAGELEGCPAEKVLELRQAIGNLLNSLIEENGQHELMVAKEVKDTIDIGALYRVMGKCYEMHQVDKPKLEDLIQKKNLTNIRGAIASAKTLAKEGSKYMKVVVQEGNTPPVKETLMKLGFTYFFILQRFYDIDRKLTHEELHITTDQEAAFKYYSKNSMSIEVLKEDILQKVNFRVTNKNVLREEVKEKLKWSVDRSSPSNKIRDLMMWSKDILKDIHYQKRILSNFLAAFLTKRWVWWNYAAIFLSLAINILMLITWKAPLSLGDIDTSNMTKLPDELFDSKPELADDDMYYTLVYIMGACHNVVSLLVMVSYFLSNHPQFPNVKGMFRRVKSVCVKDEDHEDDEDDDGEVEHKSKLDVRFFSLKTFYYMLFFGFSLAGTFSNGYFFAFHLLNIVNNNQLLGGVIQAVTQNGKSLLWVAILGLVIFYLYAIVGFAMFRDVFDPDQFMYCASLWQCTVTIVRYGLVGDYSELFVRHELMNTFTNFGYLAIFQVSFFICITTIGLNIIFGIIVDTFSELRDLKWTAESDMRDTCFICSRKSYDFEHHAQGFIHHVKQEHNMWAYIFFLIHLDNTKPNDYTALDLYVSDLLRDDRHDFFPLNRALSLSTMDEDSTESKIDELLQYVMSLVQKQKEEESERKRQEERMQQRRWQEIHRQQQRALHSDVPQEQDTALRRMLQVRDTGRPDWVTMEFETTHL